MAIFLCLTHVNRALVKGRGSMAEYRNIEIQERAPVVELMAMSKNEEQEYEDDEKGSFSKSISTCSQSSIPSSPTPHFLNPVGLTVF